LFWMYSIGNYINKSMYEAPTTLEEIGKDSKIVESIEEQKELIILVVVDTASVDRFSMNVYEKESYPLLKQEKIINFPNM
ncbi:phosphoethanolamine transferase, partial [Aliarcobacter butzleri]